MSAKTKTILLIAFLFFAYISGVQAQEKYDFASVSYTSLQKPQIIISYSSKPAETIELTKEETSAVRSIRDISPLLKYAAKMQDDGWEFMSVEGSAFFFRKKQQ